MRKLQRLDPGLSLLAFVTAMLVQAPAAYGADCRVGDRPAATLLVPYFEVDLEDPAGRTTLISIGKKTRPSGRRWPTW